MNPSEKSPTAVSLPEFLSTTEIGRLSVEDRRLIVRQALVLLEQNYALLSFKMARYGIDPVRRLRLLAARLDGPGTPEPEWRFHAEVVDIFNSLRDLHTRYALPRPFTSAAAHLPFLLKEFTEQGRLRYLVGRRLAAPVTFDSPTFGFGVEVTHWNGVPIARAIERFAERMPGANPEARHARAVQLFTVRSLRFGPPPDEDWLTVRYLHDGDRADTIDLVWNVEPVVPELATPPAPGEHPVGLDVEAVHLARLRTRLFAPEFLAAEETGRSVATGPEGVDVASEMSTVFEARRVSAGGRVFGHLRIREFKLPESTLAGIMQYVNEFIRLLGELPPDGLVLDIRSNPGGAVLASELCLQALTARAVEPEPAQFAATPLNLRICRADDSRVPWVPSMEQALESGAPHSAGIPFTPPGWLARVPQSYFGPVILVTDARSYSAADMFAAGFQDNRIGLVLGVDGNTGAGGGNVWRMADLLGSLPTTGDFPFRPLPGGADLSLVIRRLLRVGPINGGTPLEDYGVVPDKRHLPTRNDVLNGDADLMLAAAGLLGDPRRFDVTLTEEGGELTATFQVLGIDRADIIVDGRPRVTADLDGNPGPVPVPGADTPETVRIIGYDTEELVAVRTFVRDGTALRLRTAFDI